MHNLPRGKYLSLDGTGTTKSSCPPHVAMIPRTNTKRRRYLLKELLLQGTALVNFGVEFVDNAQKTLSKILNTNRKSLYLTVQDINLVHNIQKRSHSVFRSYTNKRSHAVCRSYTNKYFHVVG